MTEKIKLSQIRPSPEPVRSTWSEMEMQSLTASINKDGLLQPPLVQHETDESGSYYEIIFGHRRVEACRRAKMKEIEAFVVEGMKRDAKLRLALIENIQREDMTPRDKAIGLKRVMEEMGLKSATAVEKAGIMPRKSASNLLMLLEQPEDVQEMVGIDLGGRGEDRKTAPLTMEHLSRTAVAGKYQDDVLRKAAREGLTSKEVWEVSKAVKVADDHDDDRRVRALIFNYPYSERVHDDEREFERYQPPLVKEEPTPMEEAAEELEETAEDGPDATEVTDDERILAMVLSLKSQYQITERTISNYMNVLESETKRALIAHLSELEMAINVLHKSIKP